MAFFVFFIVFTMLFRRSRSAFRSFAGSRMRSTGFRTRSSSTFRRPSRFSSKSSLRMAIRPVLKRAFRKPKWQADLETAFRERPQNVHVVKGVFFITNTTGTTTTDCATQVLDTMYSATDVTTIFAETSPAGLVWAKARMEMTLSNAASNHPLNIRIWKLKFRRDLPHDVTVQQWIQNTLTAMGSSASLNVQGVTPFHVYGLPVVAKISDFAAFQLPGGGSKFLTYFDNKIRKLYKSVDQSLYYSVLRGSTVFYVNAWHTPVVADGGLPAIPTDPALLFSSVVTYDYRTPNPDLPTLVAIVPNTGVPVSASGNVEQFTTGTIIPGV